MKEISVVIPVYKSEKCISELTKQISDALKDFNWELILVNDCSPDNSWTEIKKVAAENNNITGINLRKNGGQDLAILAGLNHAKGKWIVIMDDDLQHSPYDIPKLYTQAQKGFDVVYADFKQKKQKLWKNLGSWLNGKVSEITLGKPKGIYLSPFKIISSSVVKEMCKLNNLFPYIDGLIFQVTKNITQINIEHHKREYGKSNFTLVKSMQVFFRMMFGFSTFPLNFATYIGFFSSTMGFVLAIYFLVKFLLGLEPLTGWTSLIMVILILGGLILLALGIIGKYIGQMYLTINNSPKYIVKETVGYEES
ncbi:glycosyltransferase family 2 protein [uncultured Treponema sp.]|uniref:glycosyltransferase family 2 protein n=1 Tax=uncultured Treponema sp. TaxID=162155 RepID=UPI00258B1C95|nr:glycosyltransferase family 2 protein [uncultured Treponema sp.]